MKKYLLDSSFIIDLLNEIADNDDEGPAFKWLKRNRRARLWISPVTLAEVLEGALAAEGLHAETLPDPTLSPDNEAHHG